MEFKKDGDFMLCDVKTSAGPDKVYKFKSGEEVSTTDPWGKAAKVIWLYIVICILIVHNVLDVNLLPPPPSPFLSLVQLNWQFQEYSFLDPDYNS